MQVLLTLSFVVFVGGRDGTRGGGGAAGTAEAQMFSG